MGHKLSSLSFAACVLALLPACAHSQAAASAIRSQSVDLYAGGSAVKTDYDSTDKGFLIGGDFTYHLRHFDGSLDVRYDHATGDRVGEKDFAGGLKLSRAFRERYHVYGNLLVGYGVITFDQPIKNRDGSLYSHDDSIVYDFGGGVDIDLTHRFALKLDAQYQYWNLGSRADADSVSFNPAMVSVGVVYHLPYRFLRPRRY